MQKSASYSQDNTQNRLSVDIMQPPSSSSTQFHFHPLAQHQQQLHHADHHQHNNQSFPILGTHANNSAALLPLSPSIFSSSISPSLSSAAPESASYPTAYSLLLNSSQQTMSMAGNTDGELPLPSFLEMFGPMLAAVAASPTKSSRAHIPAKHHSSYQYSRPLSTAPPHHNSVLGEAVSSVYSKKRKKSEEGLSASGSSLPHLSLLLDTHDNMSAINNMDNVSLSDRDRDRAILNASNSFTVGGSATGGRVSGSQQPQGPTVPGFGAVSVSQDIDDDEPDPSYDYAIAGLGSDESTGRWTAEEHKLFLEGIMLYGKDWKKMLPLIKTRTLVQIRTHAQKVFKKIANKGQGEGDTGEASAEAVERRPSLS